MLRKLAGQTAIYGISSILARAFNFMLTPYLTRIMGQGEYGVVTDFYALIPFMLTVLTMGLESGYFRFAGKEPGAAGKRGIFATLWGAVIAASAVFMAAVLLFKPQIASAMNYGDRSHYVWLVGLIIALDAVTAIPYAKLREEGRAGRYVVVRTLSIVINVALCFFFYSVLPKISDQGLFASPTDPGYVLVANLISSALVMVMLVPSCDRIWPRIDRKVLRKVMVYSLPLLVGGIAGTANEFIDRQMVKYLLPEGEAMEALGVYGAVLKLASIMAIFTQIYRMGAEPFFLADFKKDDFRRANAEAMKYYIIAALFIFLVIVFYADLFGMILGKEFREGMYVLPVILVSNLLSGVIMTLSFWYKQLGATKFAILITGTGLLFTVVFNVLLVPSLGYFGAAIARLICESAMVVMSYMLNRKYYPIPYDLKRIAEYAVLGAVMYGISIPAAGMPMWPRYFLFFALIVIFVLYAVRREKISIKRLF
jgi:O-antigen/teichoic acid export membrane protein